MEPLARIVCRQASRYYFAAGTLATIGRRPKSLWDFRVACAPTDLNAPAAAGEAAAAFDADAVEGDLFNGFGIEVPLGLLDAGVEGGGGVVVVHRDGLLGYDGAGVDALIDEMDGAAGDFDAVIEGLFPCFESREGGEE